MALLFALVFCASSSLAHAWDNVLKDPGFEAYRLDPRGFYTLDEHARWQEITLGRGSVQFNAGNWKAPKAMSDERPTGFSPGTTGFEGLGPDQNSGRIILQQDVTNLQELAEGHPYYEAWIWFAGGGNDDEYGEDWKDEVAGWEIFFYDNTDTSAWKEGDAIEYHSMRKDFWGDPNTFVQIAGFGKLPAEAKAFRMRVWASTWSTAKQPKAGYATEVAVDNAHFAVIKAPNMLINGDFELDDRVGEFKGWSRPAQWPFGRNGIRPLDINNVYGENFDHGVYRPFYGANYAYGYATYLSGWGRDAFTFGQMVDYSYPPGTPLVLTLNWIQNVAQGGKDAQARFVGTNIQIAVEYLDKSGKRIGGQGFWHDWPVPQSSANVCRYDQNLDTPYAPRMPLDPPKGTARIGVHVNFIVNMPYKDDYCHMSSAVDDLFLMPVSTSAIPAGSAG